MTVPNIYSIRHEISIDSLWENSRRFLMHNILIDQFTVQLIFDDSDIHAPWCRDSIHSFIECLFNDLEYSSTIVRFEDNQNKKIHLI